MSHEALDRNIRPLLIQEILQESDRELRPFFSLIYRGYL